MPKPAFVIRQNVASHYYVTLLLAKHDIGFTSESYKTHEAALRGIEAFKLNARFNNRYERLVSPRKELYFALRGPDNQILGTSAMFSSESAREKAIRIMKRVAPTADLQSG